MGAKSGEAGDKPLVSMILTTRDRPRFLEVALRCYEHQSYAARELIVRSVTSQVDWNCRRREERIGHAGQYLPRPGLS